MVVIALAALPLDAETHSCKTYSRGSIYLLTDPISNFAHINQSPRYQAFDLPNVEPALFTTLDNDHNTRRRRQVLPLYQVKALTNIEFQVDSTVNIFLAKMETFARSGTVIDMTRWLHFYTFDTTGALTVCISGVTNDFLLIFRSSANPLVSSKKKLT